MNEFTVLLSQPWADRLGWTLVHFIWQGAVIALALAVARVWMISPRTRHAAACVALLAMVVAPAITFGLLGTNGASYPPALPISNTPAPASASASSALASPALLSWLVFAWIMGVMLLSLRLMGGWISAARLRFSGARPAPAEWQTRFERLSARMNITRRVRLLVSPHVDVPAVLGWLRPIVLAPVAALSGLAPEHVEALLAHELAHVRRHDYLIHLLQALVETLLFYHPAVWWVSAQIRTERELCCDDLAVAVTADVLTYARALAELETGRPRVRTAIAADGGSLMRRIARLIGPARAPHTRPRPAAAIALITALIVTIGGLAASGAAQPRESKASVRNLGVLMSPQVSSYPTVERNSIWVDTVKRGDLRVEVRGLGRLISPNLAELQIAETQAKEVRIGQLVTIDYRGPQLLHGTITKVHPEVQNKRIAVDVATSGLPANAGRPPLDVDGTIQIRTVPNVVYVGRPVFGRAESTGTLYRVEPDGNQATRVVVQFGESSVNTIEVRAGLAPGDKVILSDVKADAERVNLR